MSTTPPYPEYRESGVDWLGSIPASWKLRRFRTVFRESSEVNGDQPVGVMLSVSGFRGIEVKVYEDEGRRRTVEEVATYRVVRPGQLAVNTMWLNYGGLGVSDLEGHVSPAYRSYWIASTENNRFIHHLMRSATYIDGYTSLLTGIRPNSLQMSRDNLMDFPILLPPPADQLWISRFLDRETAEIDAFIADQEELIDLLAERRDATWQSAVDSLQSAEVPLRRAIATIVDGPFGSSLTSGHYSNDGARVVRLGNIGINVFKDVDQVFISLDYYAQLSYHSVREGDVVVAGLGDDRMPLGRAAVVPQIGPAIVKADCYRVRRNHLATSEYIAWILSAPQTRARMAVLSRGSTRQRLNTTVVRDVLIPLPSISEQERVVAQSHDSLAALDAASADAREAIALSRERRAALISAAVTGKIDVREHGAVA